MKDCTASRGMRRRRTTEEGLKKLIMRFNYDTIPIYDFSKFKVQTDCPQEKPYMRVQLRL